jgi:hypothetical protein
VFKTIHELTESGPRERKALTEMFYTLSEIERHFIAFVDVKGTRRRKPRAKPGPPNIDELKQLLVPRRKKRQRNDQPGLFTTLGPAQGGDPPQNESESCE